MGSKVVESIKDFIAIVLPNVMLIAFIVVAATIGFGWVENFGDVWWIVFWGVFAVWGVFRFHEWDWADVFADDDDDEPIVTGKHIEITFDKNGKGIVKEVEEYSYSFHVSPEFVNFMVFLGLLIAIIGVGTFLFIYRVIRRAIS